MNWGVRIIILYLGFVALIVTMVSVTMREKVDLVSKDYYQQELDYQQLLDKQQRTQKLGDDQLHWNLEGNLLVLNFPRQLKDAAISGEVLLFRPSDASLDRKYVLPAISGGKAAIPLRNAAAGYYKIKVTWSAAGSDYFNDGYLQLP